MVYLALEILPSIMDRSFFLLRISSCTSMGSRDPVRKYPRMTCTCAFTRLNSWVSSTITVVSSASYACTSNGSSCAALIALRSICSALV